MENNEQDYSPRGVLSGITIALFSAFVSVLFFAAFYSLAYVKKMPFGNMQAVILQTTAILTTVVMYQYLSRKIQGNKLSIMQAFLGGWMASLILALFVITFYSIFQKITKINMVPDGSGVFSSVLMLYSAIGMFISLIFALILKKS